MVNQLSYEQRGIRSSLQLLYIVVCLAAFTAVATAGVVAYNNSHQDIHTQVTKTVTVHAGDNLWSIAESVNTNDEQDTRAIVDEIEQMNHLPNVELQVGETLKVPVGH